MADLQKTVSIIFNAVDNTGGTISDIGSNIQSFAGSAQNITSPLADLGDMVLKANTAIVALGASLVGVAINEAGKFQTSINEIGTLFGGTTEQISSFGQEVLNYSGNSVKSIEDINGAIYSAVSAGVAYSDSLEFMSEAEKLSVAGKADLNSTTVALVSTLNAFGASTSEAAKYSDVLFQTVRLGQTTLPELAGSLAQVTGIASAAGIPFNDLSAAIAALTAYGLPTSQAITGLKAAISNIIKPTSEAEETAKLLGIQFDSNALKSKGFAGVLGDVYQATNGNVGEMTKLFGSVEGLNAALTLGKDGAGKFAGAIDGMAESSGATAAAFETMSQNADLMAQRLKNSVDTALITAGLPLQDEFARILQAVGDMFAGLTVSFGDGTFDGLFGSLEKLLADLGAYFAKIAAALPEALKQVDFSGLQAAFGDLGEAFASIFEGMDLTSTKGLADAIQFIVDSIGSLLQVGSGILAQWGEWSGEIVALIQSFNSLSTGQKQAAGETLGLAQQLNILFSVAGQVGNGIEAIGTAFEALATIQMAKFITGATSAKEALAAIQVASAGAGVALAGVALTGGLAAAAGAAGYGVGTVLNAGIDLVVEKLGGGKGGLGGLIYDLTHDTSELGKSASAAGPKLAGMGDAVGEMASQARAGVGSTEELLNAADKTGERADDLIRIFQTSAKTFGDWADAQVLAATKTGFLADAADALAVATGKVKEETRIAADGMGGFTQGIGQSAEAMSKSAHAYLETARAAGTLEEAQKVVRAEYDKIHATFTKAGTAVAGYKGTMEAASAASKGSAKDLIALTKVAGDHEAKLTQIASNEKIKVIESTIKLNIAQIEADAKIAVAIIEGIGQTYTANTSLIGELLTDADNYFNYADRTKIAFAAEANIRVNEIHEAQLNLIRAQSDNLDAKTRALQNGTPTMTVRADGLQPHLEAFMWEILKAIQVKMAYDGGDMLVGGCTL